MPRRLCQLAGGAGFTVEDLRIRERTRSWSEPEAAPGHRVVFVRRGLFGLRTRDWGGLVDPLVAYLRLPGEEQRIAHRPDTEDACTVVTLTESAAAELLPTRISTQVVLTTGTVDLAHRRVLALARQGLDPFALSEAVIRLVADVFGDTGARDHPALPSHRRLAESARELLAADPACSSFEELARQLGVSRPHLSRVFRRATGQSLATCRTRLRVRAACDRIEAGQANLAELAGELGFADHAHLTRTMRAELGMPPTRVRELLAGGT